MGEVIPSTLDVLQSSFLLHVLFISFPMVTLVRTRKTAVITLSCSHYQIFFCNFDQINATSVSIRYFSKSSNTNLRQIINKKYLLKSSVFSVWFIQDQMMSRTHSLCQKNLTHTFGIYLVSWLTFEILLRSLLKLK